MEQEQFDYKMEQEVDDKDLARAVTACRKSCTIRDDGAPEACIGEIADQLKTCVKAIDAKSRRSQLQQES